MNVVAGFALLVTIFMLVVALFGYMDDNRNRYSLPLAVGALILSSVVYFGLGLR